MGVFDKFFLVFHAVFLKVLISERSHFTTFSFTTVSEFNSYRTLPTELRSALLSSEQASFLLSIR